MSRSRAGSDLFPPNLATAVPVAESSQIGEARRVVTSIAAELGFGETTRGRVAIVASELATNLALHGGGGELVVRPLQGATGCGVEIIALDRGRGIPDVDRAVRDGFSTGGTAGRGLGGVGRLTSAFEMYSARGGPPPDRSRGVVATGVGTAVLARLWDSGAGAEADTLSLGVVSLPFPGESLCGDGWAVERDGARAVFVVTDGLGHGPEAARASAAALHVFRRDPMRGPAAILNAMHTALRPTRGAAVAIADINTKQGSLAFAGVGNISAAVVSGDSVRNMMSHNGTAGLAMRTVREIAYDWPDGALLVMHSDGLRTRWRLDAYPGLGSADPSLIAAVLYRDFARGPDDLTALVARHWQ